ncbi:protein CREG1 [Sesamum indicum]|uniref:Protein CREG1 n=1 Tax=Sesamum indicum TaxID=4182 RepID=A0A6I9STA0_SESIN|nr:protein CREG1 [Sesamum indicum]
MAMILHNFLLAPILFVVFIIFTNNQDISQAAAQTPPRPDPKNAPLFARWLVSQGSWGVLNTLDYSDLTPFGNVMSYSDAGTGTPYFYLTTTRDPTGLNALKYPRSSFTLSEYELGTCNATTDPQSPLCAKITLSGRLRLLNQNSAEAASAEAALFRDHPQLAGWPKQNGFVVFKLDIKRIFLVNEFVPAKYPKVFDYFNSKI